tara:strand:- start:518 stop:937 length:420 start_codon:yes stop_codon:yes gene_type:complete
MQETLGEHKYLKQVIHESNTAGIDMDLIKMHPMARKMEQAQRAFIDALENGNGSLAKQHLTEVQKLSDFLADDLQGEITKGDVVSPQGPQDMFAGGVPVMKFETPKTDTILKGDRLGFTSSTRLSKNYTRKAGSYGRRV